MKTNRTQTAVALLGVLACLSLGAPAALHAAPPPSWQVKAVLVGFTHNTVLPTYKDMADNSVKLAAATAALREGVTDEKIAAAAALWKSTRAAWEQGECFLFGPAAFNNLDPLLDSWPLDQGRIDRMIKIADDDIDAGFVRENLGSGVRGFHAVEYLLFKDGRARRASELSKSQAAYLAAITDALRDDCITLEAWWAGTDKIGEAKAKILEDAEIEPGTVYASEFVNAGRPGSRYATQNDALVELVQGCVDIVTEAGSVKIGDPVASGDPLQVESWFSWDSLADIVNNLKGVENAWLGGVEGKRGKGGLTLIVSALDKNLDRKIREQLKTAIEKVNAIPAPLRNNLKDPATRPAIDACNELARSLEAVLEKIG
ncbi:peptidase M75 [Opitutaceae bacterium TAV5]|nr:peptidase M75 [Opitutaceae bacterium TAV5]